MKKRQLITLAIAAVVIIGVLITAAIVGKSTPLEGTFWSLVPALIAIGLALVTKEVYSSLFIGILSAALFASNFSFTGTMNRLISFSVETVKDNGEIVTTSYGLIPAVSGTAGIFVFLVILGAIVALINKAGAAQAFGRWAEKHIKTKVGALLATFLLGVLIFIDDYFNCLTVGSVMAPVTDSKKISRAKLAYLIDATAAPICMIAPISSWSAAVSSIVNETKDIDPAIANMGGIELFVRSIPFNFYSLFTLVFVVGISLMAFDYGKMAGFEIKAQSGDLGANADQEDDNKLEYSSRGRVFDIIIPVVVLIVSCVFALIYVGGFFAADSEYYHDFAGSFGNTDSTVALPWGGLIALVFTIIYFLLRKVTDFGGAMKSLGEGFIAMVPAILILTFATTLKGLTGLLGSEDFVSNLMSDAGVLAKFLPAIIFLVACVISFATGTSWGTFGILIPIVLHIFKADDQLLFVAVSACLAGSVCGDHCSPISDTTIMASAGAECKHVEHVSTQLPYALTVAGISFVTYILAGFVPYWYVCLPVGAVLTLGTLFVFKFLTKKQAA